MKPVPVPWLILPLLICLAGCTAVSVSPADVVQNYTSKLGHSTLQELHEDTQQRLALSDGYWKSYLERELKWVERTQRLLEEYAPRLVQECSVFLPRTECQKQHDERYKNYAIPTIVQVLAIENVSITKTQAVILVRRKITEPWGISNSIISYVLTPKGNSWTIVDAIEDGTPRSSELGDAEYVADRENLISTLQKELAETLALWQRAQRDKCAAYTRTTAVLTESERQEEESICYNGKYIQQARSTKDPKICDDIISEPWLAQCYAAAAVGRNDASLCDSVPMKTYDAKAFYDPLTTGDVCLWTFILSKNTANTYQEVRPLCPKITNGQMRGQCEEFRDQLKAYEDSLKTG